jgi:hypothetical protein
MTRFFRQSGVPLVSLSRVDVADGSVVDTAMELPGDGYIVGSISVDATGRIWMAWGRTLAAYDPHTTTVRTWQLPPVTEAAVVHADQPGLDGNGVALAIDSVGEVWLAVDSVQTAVGFNPAREAWDRTLQLPLVPILRTRLDASQPGLLSVNGVVVEGTLMTPALATIDTAVGTVVRLRSHVFDYVVNGANELDYVDDTGGMQRLTAGSSVATTLTAGLPIAANPYLAVDPARHVWFSMAAFETVGIAALDLGSGTIATYPFPSPDRSGTTPDVGPGLVCPQPSCATPHNPTFDPRIQAIVPDGHGNIWVIDSLPGKGEPNSYAALSPIEELTLSE